MNVFCFLPFTYPHTYIYHFFKLVNEHSFLFFKKKHSLLYFIYTSSKVLKFWLYRGFPPHQWLLKFHSNRKALAIQQILKAFSYMVYSSFSCVTPLFIPIFW